MTSKRDTGPHIPQEIIDKHNVRRMETQHEVDLESMKLPAPEGRGISSL